MSDPEETAAPPGEESESDLRRNRRENLKRVEELGYPASPVRFGVAATIS